MPVLEKKERLRNIFFRGKKPSGISSSSPSTLKKYRYDCESKFSQQDYNDWLLTFQEKGVSLKSLYDQLEEYIDSNLQLYQVGVLPTRNAKHQGKTSNFIIAGLSVTLQDKNKYWNKSSITPAYLYIHTINEFYGVSLEFPTVVYLGISTDEKPDKTTFNSQYSLRTDKNKRSFIWHSVIQKSGKIYETKAQQLKIHIYPTRIITEDILKLEEYFIRKLGCLIINPNTEHSLVNHGALFNIKTTNGKWDPVLHSQRIKEHFDRNPQLKGKEGVISQQQTRNWENNPERKEAAHQRITNYYQTITPEQKKQHFDNLRKTFTKIEKWAASFLEDYAYGSNYWCPNGGSLLDQAKTIEISDEYTEILLMIQKNDYFTRISRPDKAIKSARKISETLVFPEYDGKKKLKYTKKQTLKNH